MEIQKAKEQVILAGKMLIEKGLIARTWGNVSCRINQDQFVITPSGKAYESLTPDDIVLVNIKDLSYEGDVKPSSEKGIHMEVYKHLPDINFVIHTHQVNASVVSTLGVDVVPLSSKHSAIGSCIPIAGYALPGTKKLRKNISYTLDSFHSKAVLMAKHGALCFGRDLEESFMIANMVEEACEAFLLDYCNQVYNKSCTSLDEINGLYLKKYQTDEPTAINIDAYVSERVGNTINLYEGKVEQLVSKIDLISGQVNFGKYLPEGELHRLIYHSRPDIKSIVHSKEEDILTVSRVGKTIYPLLDDFAQIIGPYMGCAVYSREKPFETAKDVVEALKKNNGVFIRNNGALCCGPCKKDAYAAELVAIKGCKAWVAASVFGNVQPINKIEARLMNFVYKNKYSKESTVKD